VAKMRIDWLDLFEFIRDWSTSVAENEIMRREIKYAEKISKKFKCKYVYSVYRYEGFESYLMIEKTPETEKWEKENVCKFYHAISLEDIKVLKHEIKYEKQYVVATNVDENEMMKLF